jgi:hypothetical protein
VLIVPVRHHSPAAALHVERLVRERRPRAILVEGPSDADALIPLLLDAETEPPVALYAYRTAGGDGDGDGARAALYPFCRYSPEYAALRAGREVGAELRFCDVPAAATLAWTEEAEADDEAPDPADGAGPSGDRVVVPTADPPIPYAAFAERLARAAGFDAFDAFWEAAFEQELGTGGVERYLAAMTDFGAMARQSVEPAVAARDAARERHMAAVAAETGTDDGVLLVCGAAHAAAVARSLAVGDHGKCDPGETPVEVALIPFSYPRLSEQLGYGAGNRAPWYYGEVWRLGNDYDEATRRALVTLAWRLRRQGLVASLAQAIEAANLAAVLAAIRGKPAAGVDEVVDAAVAAFGQGQPTTVREALREVLVGEAVGRVTPRVGRTPLQAEFYAETGRLRLPVLDAPRQVLVHLADRREAAQSVFLHRLVTAEVPFGRELEGGLGGRGRAAEDDPLAQLGRVREKWELHWSPATDARLVERSAWGGSLVEVCRGLLRRRLAAATRVDEGSGILLRMALCDLPAEIPSALARCEGLAAGSADFPALARAAHHLDGLLAYGTARRLPEDRLADLGRRLFARAAVQLPAAVVCGDDAAEEVRAALLPLADLVRRGRPTAASPARFWQSVETVAELEAAHPGLRGLALSLLETGGRLPPGELARRLRAALVRDDAAANARLIAGLFALQRSALVRNRAIVAATTEFLLGLSLDQLTPLLPALRRGLGDLSGGERAYLLETIGAVLGLEAQRAWSVPTPSEAVVAWVREADAAVAATLADWEGRYGLG